MRLKFTDKLMVGIAVAGLLAGCQGMCEAAQNGRGDKITLAQAGRTPYAIALAESASAPEKNAAAELAAYLKKITGAEFAIVAPSAAAGRPVIAVGPGAAKAIAPKLDLTKAGPAGLGEDGIVLQAGGKNLVLTGAAGAKRGTLYAVYEFLERACGVRWWTPTEETVPNRPTLAVTLKPIRYVPPFFYRETLCDAIRPMIWETTDEVPRFAVRQRQNGHFPKIPGDWGGHHELLGWAHTFFALLPPDKYFNDHPDWYSESSGRRVNHFQLCLTNDEMIEELTRTVLAELRKQPESQFISVSQNDNCGFCTCKRCRECEKKEGSYSGPLLYAINKVAESVEREFPDCLVETLAYQATRRPPTSIRPRRNVVIRYSVIERSPVQPLTHEINRVLLDDLKGWAKVKANILIWDYSANLENPFTPEPRALFYGPDIRLYGQLCGKGVFYEHCHSYSAISDFYELHTWLLSKLLWNPEQDDRALIRDFLLGYYGPAARPLEHYLDLLSNKIGDYPLESWNANRNAKWLDLKTMNRATELMNEAATAVGQDPVLDKRVQRARMSLDFQWLEGFVRYRAIAKREKQPFAGPADFSKASESFIALAKEFRVETVGYLIKYPLEAYLNTTSARMAVNPNKQYEDFVLGERMPLPPELSGFSARKLIDIQEDQMTYFGGGETAFDESAVNAAAARLDTRAASWSVQIKNLPRKGIEGRWHAYAVIRVDASAESGVAFQAGIYDEKANTYPLLFTQNLEGNSDGRGSAESIADSKYRVYDFGQQDFGDATVIWFSTAGGVDPKNVKAIYVDRFLFVKEP